MCPILDNQQAVELLLQNQVVAIPTETVYGLFGLATSQQAVNTVYKAKNRPADNPLICHFYSLEQMLEYVKMPQDYILEIINTLCPAPLTIVLETLDNRLLPATSGLKTVCCRIPNDLIALEILKAVNVPLFGPSANTSTKVSGVFAQMIQEDLEDKIAGVVDGGFCSVGVESTIIDPTENGKIKILRPGTIGKFELEKVLTLKGFGDIEVIENATSQTTTPGAKYRHYSPNAKIILGNPNHSYANTVVIGLKEFLPQVSADITILDLGSKNDLEKVSASLFYNLYLVDKSGSTTAIFDLESYNFLQQSNSSIAKAVLNRLNKVLG
jgi:L-threonylcarbamoyladenylate synthase